jgi:hypothetical protein
MKKQKKYRLFKYFIIAGVFSFIAITLQGANAPVTTAATVINAIPGQKVTVPLTVTGFSNIGSCYLTMDYEYSKLHFVSGINNPALIGFFNVGEYDLKNGMRRITISWTGSGGLTLPDGSYIVNLDFTFISGPAQLLWYDMGPSCEYADATAKVLTDTPQANYYNVGLVSDNKLELPIITATGSTSFCDGGKVSLTSSLGSAYLWSTGETTPSIDVSKTGSYKVTVTDAGGIKLTSAATVVTVAPIPTAPTAGLTQTSCSLATGTITVNSDKTGMSFSINGSTYTNTTGIFSGLIPGNYTITAMSSAGCISHSSAKFTIVNQPVSPIVIITNPGSVILPATVNLTSSTITTGSTPGLVFTYWLDAAATVAYKSPENATSGNYYIKGSAPVTGCWDIKPVTVLVNPNQSTGLGTTETKEDNLSAYAIRNNEIQINGTVSKQAIATIYDIQGRVVLVKNLEESSMNTISTSNIKGGIYLLCVKDRGQMHSFRIPVKD